MIKFRSFPQLLKFDGIGDQPGPYPLEILCQPNALFYFSRLPGVVVITHHLQKGYKGDIYHGYIGRTRIVAKIFSHNYLELLQKESKIYQCLQHLQGHAIPVFLGLFGSRMGIVLLMTYEGSQLTSFEDLSTSQWYVSVSRLIFTNFGLGQSCTQA
jgi:hypothetical protein